jgi:hypothetical protein
MSGFRIPGPLCSITNALPVDEGTRAVAAMPAPGAVGRNRPGLDPNDPEVRQHLALIESLKEGNYTLRSLRAMRSAHASVLIDAVFEFGEQSKAAQLQRLTLKTLDGLIATTSYIENLPSRTQSDVAALGDLLDRAERGGPGSPKDAEIRAGVRKVLVDERQGQLLGVGENTKVMPMVMRALDISGKRHRQELAELAQKGLRDPDRVPDAQIREAVATVFGDERQSQLLGGAPRTEELNQAMRQAAQLWLRKRSIDLERAYDSGVQATIEKAEASYEAAKRTLVEYGGTVVEAEVSPGTPQARR